MSENNDDENISKPQEEEVLETSNDDSNDDDESIDWEAKAKKAEELATNYKIRAEKAEKIAKGKTSEKPQEKPEQDSSNLSSKDTIALMNAKVHEDDIEEVQEIAKLKKISVAEALKLDLTKTVLAQKAEFRKTADATNTQASRKGATKISEDKLQENLSKGEIPEKGSDEAERLFWARRGGKK